MTGLWDGWYPERGYHRVAYKNKDGSEGVEFDPPVVSKTNIVIR
jgi:hypothetical protein